MTHLQGSADGAEVPLAGLALLFTVLIWVMLAPKTISELETA